MRVLLDTHAVIWWVDQDSLLSNASHAAIAKLNGSLAEESAGRSRAHTPRASAGHAE
jgi:hypothetical protein